MANVESSADEPQQTPAPLRSRMPTFRSIISILNGNGLIVVDPQHSAAPSLEPSVAPSFTNQDLRSSEGRLARWGTKIRNAAQGGRDLFKSNGDSWAVKIGKRTHLPIVRSMTKVEVGVGEVPVRVVHKAVLSEDTIDNIRISQKGLRDALDAAVTMAVSMKAQKPGERTDPPPEIGTTLEAFGIKPKKITDKDVDRLKNAADLAYSKELKLSVTSDYLTEDNRGLPLEARAANHRRLDSYAEPSSNLDSLNPKAQIKITTEALAGGSAVEALVNAAAKATEPPDQRRRSYRSGFIR